MVDAGLGRWNMILFLIPRLCCENVKTPSHSLSWLHWRMVHCLHPQSQCELLTSHNTIIVVYGCNRKLSPWHSHASSQGFTKRPDACKSWALGKWAWAYSSHASVLQISGLPSSSAFITVQIQGPTQNFTKRKPMQITKADSLVFVQTDKPIYKPGQTVKFRVVSVDISFHPLNETFPVIYIENPKRNRIFQWQNIDLLVGLHQLSFPLSDEPALGNYKVVVQKDSGKKINHSFKVDEYGKNSPSVRHLGQWNLLGYFCVYMWGVCIYVHVEGGMFSLCVYICGW